MQEIVICRKQEKVGKQKSRKRIIYEKVGNWKMWEIGISQKWERVRNQKNKEIQKKQKSRKEGNQRKQEIRKSRKSKKKQEFGKSRKAENAGKLKSR